MTMATVLSCTGKASKDSGVAFPCHVCLATFTAERHGAGMTTTDRLFDIIGFDLDGTLLDTIGDIAAALSHGLGSVGRGPLPVGQVQTMVGRGLRVLIARALDATGGG